MITWILRKALASAMSFRCDGSPDLDYFDGAYFGVKPAPFSFQSGKWTLRGCKYCVTEKPKGVLIFFHGIGAGHTSYTNEICAFAKQGYLVYAYDNTGCMTSEGRGIGSLAQSLLDQEAFFAFLDQQEDARGLPRIAAGHSWGGFTALGALQEKYHVEKAICISGFLSLPQMLMNQVKGLKKFEGALKKALKKDYGPYGDLDTIGLLSNTKASVLYIQGEADQMVPKAENYDVLQRLFSKKENIHLLLVEGAMHQPYWTLEANKYFVDLYREHHMTLVDFDVNARVDYDLLNHDEPKVLQAMFDFLDS